MHEAHAAINAALLGNSEDNSADADASNSCVPARKRQQLDHFLTALSDDESSGHSDNSDEDDEDDPTAEYIAHLDLIGSAGDRKALLYVYTPQWMQSTSTNLKRRTDSWTMGV